MHHTDHLAGRSVGQLTAVDISALILRAKAFGTPAVMLVANKGCITSVLPSAIDSTQGMTGLVAVGRVAWLRVAGNQQDKGGAESPDRIISTQPGAAWCAFQAWAGTMSDDEAAPLQAFPILGRDVRDLVAQDILMLQEYAAGTGYKAIEICVDADCFVTEISFVDADLDVLENGRYGCVVIGREVDPLAAWAVLVIKALDTSQGKG